MLKGKELPATLFAILLLASMSAAQIGIKSQNLVTSDTKRLEAEQLVIRAMQRFGQTLDFKIIFREFFIKDKSVRRILFESDLKDDNYDLTNFDDTALEEVYMSGQNWYWLGWMCFYRANKKGDYKSNNEDPQSLIKREVFQNLPNVSVRYTNL